MLIILLSRQSKAYNLRINNYMLKAIKIISKLRLGIGKVSFMLLNRCCYKLKSKSKGRYNNSKVKLLINNYTKY